jgi:hypothetical protein
VRLDLCGRALVGDMAVVEDVDALRSGERCGQILLDQHDRLTGPRQLTTGVHQIPETKLRSSKYLIDLGLKFWQRASFPPHDDLWHRAGLDIDEQGGVKATEACRYMARPQSRERRSMPRERATPPRQLSAK